MRALSPLRIRVLSVGKGRDRLLSELSGRYVERLGRLASVTLGQVQEAAGRGRIPAEAMRLEAEALRGALAGRRGLARSGGSGAGRSGAGRAVAGSSGSGKTRRNIVALDEGGQLLTSRDLAGTLTTWAGQGVQEACFLVGGDEGLDDALVAEADLVLSLSRMTFTHEMARVLLLEQLYRAHAILGGLPYHRD